MSSRPTGFEFRVPRVLDEDSALEVDPAILPALASDARGLYDDAVCLTAISATPISVAGRRGRKRNDAT